MSTAVALQDMSTVSQQETGKTKHRAVSKTTTTTSTSSQDDDPWLKTPQDFTTSNLALDSHSFNPTGIYWITPHGFCTSKITILNLTKDMDVPYTNMTNEYKTEVKRTLKDHSFTPAITLYRENWMGLKYNIKDDQGQHVAHWSHHWSSTGKAVLTFPEDSPHSTHPISLRNRRWGFRTETFTVNSQPYFWEMDSYWHSTNMTLYKMVGTGEGQKKVEIGKYAQKWWGSFLTGGVFVVDEKELDGVVACLTLVVVLKKKRQRAAEHNPGGGGGAGS